MAGTSNSCETIKNCETGPMGGTLPSANRIHTVHATVISFALFSLYLQMHAGQ